MATINTVLKKLLNLYPAWRRALADGNLMTFEPRLMPTG
ncbi:hypothetical protein C7451_1154 [Blastomonas natatoria]|jgi:hypothetical protein|uniref:Uncharacterized protein n=1 Tax=Blastomonas natatoria TaxID=34015 RepID=A0A2V3UQS0_9SPHN|nr:hypothetical protein C7451_1154 [Blastomonas natatoria]